MCIYYSTIMTIRMVIKGNCNNVDLSRCKNPASVRATYKDNNNRKNNNILCRNL